jgi:alkylated DNA repair protein (DNA oxidative demethylase)
MLRRVAARYRGEHLGMAPRLLQARVVPEGLTYRDDFLSADEERTVLRAIEGLEFDEFVMRGQAARRTVRSFGWRYRFHERVLLPGDPLPRSLAFVRERAEQLAGVASGAFEQALVTRYPPGATIGWHRDAPPFGPTIAGVSLAAPCRMRFQRVLDEVRYVHEQVLRPRSAYVLAGTARSAWEHSIPATEHLRYSITFRTIKRR